MPAAGLPTGVTAIFNPTLIVALGSGTSTLTLTVASTTTTGVYPITVTSGGTIVPLNLSITVQ